MSITHLQPTQHVKLRGSLDEISNSMARMEGDREFIKEVKKKLKEELQLDAKLINRLAKTHYKKNFVEQVEGDKEFETTYEVINSNVPPNVQS